MDFYDAPENLKLLLENWNDKSPELQDHYKMMISSLLQMTNNMRPSYSTEEKQVISKLNDMWDDFNSYRMEH